MGYDEIFYIAKVSSALSSIEFYNNAGFFLVMVGAFSFIGALFLANRRILYSAPFVLMVVAGLGLIGLSTSDKTISYYAKRYGVDYCDVVKYGYLVNKDKFLEEKFFRCLKEEKK